ncbi:MAG: DUF5994 family protein [Sporichthyaceae bacterium]
MSQGPPDREFGQDVSLADATARSTAPDALRLHLNERRSAERGVDGAWWPHGDDLVAEATRLMVGAEHLVGQIDRLVVHGQDWPEHPLRFVLGERVVRVGYASSAPSMVRLVRRDGADIDLLLIPPTATEEEAAAAIARALDGADRTPAGEMFGRS